jgi:hypothetical protein
MQHTHGAHSPSASPSLCQGLIDQSGAGPVGYPKATQLQSELLSLLKFLVTDDA